MRAILCSLVALGLLSTACERAAPAEHASPESPPSRLVNQVSHVVEGRPNPKELGWVRWHRNFDEAKAKARREQKPIFLLFQEVPGCATCVGFGESVLSHPLMVEAIETAFVPVAIHNNKGGDDKKVLDAFQEPSWNNPVVRIVDADAKDIIPRADGIWSVDAIAARMASALSQTGQTVPSYLQWVRSENTPTPKKATFAMGCYWSGEACLGAIDGVTETRAAWLGGREVVEVWFDAKRIDAKSLRLLSDQRRCGEFVARAGSGSAASASDQKYHLLRSRARYLPLSPLQSARVNAALAAGTDVAPWLSPRQLALFARLKQASEQQLAGLERPKNGSGSTLSPAALARYDAELRHRLSQ